MGEHPIPNPKDLQQKTEVKMEMEMSPAPSEHPPLHEVSDWVDEVLQDQSQEAALPVPPQNHRIHHRITVQVGKDLQDH